jgi:FkbM family methyltransferase
MSTLQKLWSKARGSTAHALGKRAAARWPFPVRVTVDGGHQLYVDLRSAIGQGLFVSGKFDMAAIEPALDALCPGATFIDVGANIGFYSVLARDRVGPTGHVYCFEMDKRPLRALRKTVSAFKLRNIEIEHAAVAAIDGRVSFSPLREHGHNRIDPIGGTGKFVRCVRLDSWVMQRELQRVDAIKIDVEGAEYLVLDGARETIARFKPTIVCEAMTEVSAYGRGPDDVVALLKEHGYQTEYLVGVHTPTIFARPRSLLSSCG